MGLIGKWKYYIQNILIEEPVLKPLKKALMNTDHLIAVSKYIKDVYAHAGIPREKISVVYNFPPTVTSLPSGEEVKEMLKTLDIIGRRVVLVVGKLSIGKGTPVMLKAASLIGREVENTVVVFVGKPAMDFDVPPEARPYVRMAGVCSQKEVMVLNALCEVSVVPGVWPEPFGRILLEAMMFEKPIVATNVGGNPEAVFDGVNGYLVERHKHVDLAEAVIKILKDTKNATRMGKEGKRILKENFSEEMIMENIIDVYNKVLS